MADKLTKILIAEDEADIREIAVFALENFGAYVVHACVNGAEVLDAARAFGPDLILLDIMMPKVDGPTALKQLRAEPDFKETPVILFTAKALRDEVAGYDELGVIGLILKPFDPVTLSDEVAALWRRARGG